VAAIFNYSSYLHQNLMKKGQVKRFDGSDVAGQARFVESLSGVAA
jgi:hypothetical protein